MKISDDFFKIKLSSMDTLLVQAVKSEVSKQLKNPYPKVISAGIYHMIIPEENVTNGNYSLKLKIKIQLNQEK